MEQCENLAELHSKVCAALLKYPKMTSDGNLQPICPQKAVVAWKPKAAPDGIQLFDAPFELYYLEDYYRTFPKETIQQGILSLVEKTAQNVNKLQFLVSETNKPRLIKKVDKIANLLSELRSDLPPLMDPWIKEQVRVVAAEEGGWTADGSSPATRLKLQLYWALREHTTLTVKNAQWHVLHLLKHFGIQQSASETDLRSLDRVLQRNKHIEHLTLAHIREYLDRVSPEGGQQG